MWRNIDGNGISFALTPRETPMWNHECMNEKKELFSFILEATKREGKERKKRGRPLCVFVAHFHCLFFSLGHVPWGIMSSPHYKPYTSPYINTTGVLQETKLPNQTNENRVGTKPLLASHSSLFCACAARQSSNWREAFLLSAAVIVVSLSGPERIRRSHRVVSLYRIGSALLASCVCGHVFKDSLSSVK